jgi:cobalt-zinc-cadmium efflux system protein
MGVHHQHSVTAGHPQDSRTAIRRSLLIALALTTSYMVVEVIGGLAANSLALLADAGHMVADAAAIGLALLAM